MLWTRLAPSPLNADGQGGMANADVAVDWQVSTTDTFSTLVASGTVTAKYADAHSVHVVAGGLSPDADYFYRFRAQGHLSPVGRTRTTPAVGTAGREPADGLRLLLALRGGLLHRLPPDGRGRTRASSCTSATTSTSTARPPAALRLHLGNEIVSLADYRRRYAQYKTDPDLQAAHAVAPWIVVPDDHEVENNYAGTIRENNTPALTAAQWTARRSAAYQAYYENMPLRPAQVNSGNSIQLYRRLRWGQSGDVPHARHPPVPQRPGLRRRLEGSAPMRTWRTVACPATHRRAGCSTGWGSTWVRGTSSASRCSSPAGSTPPGASMDSWDGYRASRARIQQGWVDRAVRNPVVLTGDVHRAWANDLKADYANANSATIGTELVTSSITSSGDGDGVHHGPRRRHQPAPEVLQQPPRLRAHDASARPSCGPTSVTWQRFPSTGPPRRP